MIRNMARVSSTFQMAQSVLKNGKMAIKEAIEELQTLSKVNLTCKMLSNSLFVEVIQIEHNNQFKSNNKLKQMFNRINHQKWSLLQTTTKIILNNF